MDGIGSIYLENQAFSTVNLPHNYSDFVQFRTCTDVQMRKYTSMFGIPGKIHR